MARINACTINSNSLNRTKFLKESVISSEYLLILCRVWVTVVFSCSGGSQWSVLLSDQQKLLKFHIKYAKVLYHIVLLCHVS